MFGHPLSGYDTFHKLEASALLMDALIAAATLYGSEEKHRDSEI